MKKVLIVDDQDAIRKMLRLTLSGRYELFEAAEASDAWEALRRVRPDAMILDIMMPGEMDGYQLCERPGCRPRQRHERRGRCLFRQAFQSARVSTSP